MGSAPPSGGSLHSRYTRPINGIPGIQLHGYFPDGCNAFQAEPALTSKTGQPFMRGCTPTKPPPQATCLAECHHDAQFVLRIPDAWNGRLLTAGTPGIRDAFASDAILSDFVLAKGWAYVSQDKGNMGANFFQGGCDERASCGGKEFSWAASDCGVTDPLTGAITDPLNAKWWCPGRAIAEWTFRMRQATRAARTLLDKVAPTYGVSRVTRSYAAGVSNGGYQVRMALETDARADRLYDGGVDWEGTLFLAGLPPGVILHGLDGQPTGDPVGYNLFTYLPTGLANWPGDVSGDPAAAAALARVGFNPESSPLWPYHWSIYWGLTQKVYRLALDPEYTQWTCADPPGAFVAGPPCVSPPVLVVPPTDPDARYDYATRLLANATLASRISAIANTGDIQRRLITLHGDQDALLPYRTDSDLYAQLVALQHRDSRYRSYVVRGGNHVDPQFDDHFGVDAYGNTVLRPMLPCVRSALGALVAWVEQDAAPPASRTIGRVGASADELANVCGLGD